MSRARYEDLESLLPDMFPGGAVDEKFLKVEVQAKLHPDATAIRIVSDGGGCGQSYSGTVEVAVGVTIVRRYKYGRR